MLIMLIIILINNVTTTDKGPLGALVFDVKPEVG